MYPDLYCLLIALGIGVIIGAEREYRSKSAGLRTMIMVIWVPANILTGLDLSGQGWFLKMKIIKNWRLIYWMIQISMSSAF